MSSPDPVFPETQVLAVASHVVHGYVGNTMAAFVMQAMGYEVSAINTVQFSNHVAYGQFRGTRTPAAEIREIYRGLKEVDLAFFDLMLSGFAPSAEAVAAVGDIGRELKSESLNFPGSFFWVLDPVMGDEGEWYVDKDVLPIYRSLLPHADLLLPNVFELEVLSDTKIDTPRALAAAISKLHTTHQVPHVVVTSVRFTKSSPTISVIGSSRCSNGTPRLFQIDVPALDCFFSGTGDLFAALTIVRLREATVSLDLDTTPSWLSQDEVSAVELPLAKAVEKVLASMQAVLEKTKARVDRVAAAYEKIGMKDEKGKRTWSLMKTKAAEVRVVSYLSDLRDPKVVFRAVPFNHES